MKKLKAVAGYTQLIGMAAYCSVHPDKHKFEKWFFAPKSR
jgi:hypothetical protein